VGNPRDEDPNEGYKDLLVRFPLSLFHYIDRRAREEDRSWSWVVRNCVVVDQTRKGDKKP